MPSSAGDMKASVHAELLEHTLSVRLGRCVSLEVASYEELERRLLEGTFDIAWVPPRLLERARTPDFLTIQPIRAGATEYGAALVCRFDQRERLQSLQGARAAWVASTSAGGYLLASGELAKRGLEVGSLFSSQRFLGSYKGALEAVLAGAADVASIYFVGEATAAAARPSLAEHVGDREAELVPLFFTAPSGSDALLVSPRLGGEAASKLVGELLEPGLLNEVLRADGLRLASPHPPWYAAPLGSLEFRAARATLEIDQQGACLRAWGSVEILKCEGARLVGRHIRELLPTVEVAGLETSLASAFEGHHTRPLEIRASAGAPRWYSVEFIGPSLAGERRSMLVTIRDVTERRALDESLIRMASFPSLDPNPSLELDRTGRALYANPAARRCFPSLVDSTVSHPLATAVLAASERKDDPSQLTKIEFAFEDRAYQLTATTVSETGLVRVFATDVTDLKLLEEVIAKARVRTARNAGMAEVATGVLHNVGNALNSVNVSVAMLYEKVGHSKLSGLTRLNALIQAHVSELPRFFSEHGAGKPLPAYLEKLTAQLQLEHQELMGEIESLRRGATHMCAIIAAQQSLAKRSSRVGETELVTPGSIVEDALALGLSPVSRGGLAVARDIPAMAPLQLDRHRLIQILVNLISNAAHAVAGNAPGDRRIELAVQHRAAGRLRFVVRDNGVGIAADQQVKIFSHGFTTREEGHGFGLHASACAAMEMAGTVTCHSEGVGRGSSFYVDLPIEPTLQESA